MTDTEQNAAGKTTIWRRIFGVFSNSANGAKKRDNSVIEYQPDALEIEERVVPGMSRWTLYTLLALITFTIIWSIVSRVDSIIVAEGKLITTAPTIVVQPLETSVIRSLDVKVGQVVKKGQSLARLDPTFTEADVSQLLQRQKSYSIQLDRLKAELDGKFYQLGSGITGNDQKLQLVIFEKRRSQREARLRSFDEKIEQLNAGVRTQKRDAVILKRRFNVLQEAVNMRSTLAKEGHGSRLKLLEARNTMLEVQRSLDLATNGLQEKKHEIASSRAEKEAFLQEWRQKVAEELVTLQREYDGVSEQLNKAQRRRDMVQLNAPSDSVVLETAGRSVGSVVREAEPLFTLVPLDVPLEAEVSIAAKDIGLIKIGDEVRIKFSAFPFQKYGTGAGIVRNISQDSFSNEGENPGPSFYKTRVSLKFDNLHDLPDNFRFIPGMTVSAEIKVGDRRIISYLTYPFLKGMDESFREP
jgi:hemolysin D